MRVEYRDFPKDIKRLSKRSGKSPIFFEIWAKPDTWIDASDGMEYEDDYNIVYAKLRPWTKVGFIFLFPVVLLYYSAKAIWELIPETISEYKHIGEDFRVFSYRNGEEED